MSNPWDPFPLPTRGDYDDRATYEGVGRVLTMWEHVEFGLSRLYSIFAGAPDSELLQKYGEGTIFQERLRILRESAKVFFIQRPSQDLEGGFCRICITVEGFSDRRNEVAHGVVFQVSEWQFFRERFVISAACGSAFFALIPAYYISKKHDENGEPVYAYTSIELAHLTTALRHALDDLHKYRQLLLKS